MRRLDFSATKVLVSMLLVGVTAAPALALAASGIPALEAQRWVNSSPLNAEGLRGKVVLVDIWEYTCINWIRTSPYVKALNRDYAKFGLVVIGVHAPEFEFGKRAENIDRGFVTTAWATRLRSTMTSRSGEPSATTPGQRSTSSTRKVTWCDGGSAKEATTRSNRRSGGC